MRMKKLSLDLAELTVESFETFVAERDRGTVRANCGCVTWSCGGTCGAAPPSDVEKNGIAPVTDPRKCCI
jgi:hypothetical protein